MDASITLYASCLFAKWGFRDGDLLGGIVYDHFPEVCSAPYVSDRPDDDLGFENNLLVTLVEGFLVPALPQRVTTERYCTTHNPIRVEDGQVLDPDLENFAVTIPTAVVIEIGKAMLAMKVARPVTIAEVEQHVCRGLPVPIHDVSPRLHTPAS